VIDHHHSVVVSIKNENQLVNFVFLVHELMMQADTMNVAWHRLLAFHLPLLHPSRLPSKAISDSTASDHNQHNDTTTSLFLRIPIFNPEILTPTLSSDPH
jgi:hypothetical protein